MANHIYFEMKLIKIKEFELLSKMSNCVNDLQLKLGYIDAIKWDINNKSVINTLNDKIQKL